MDTSQKERTAVGAAALHFPNLVSEVSWLSILYLSSSRMSSFSAVFLSASLVLPYSPFTSRNSSVGWRVERVMSA